MDFAKASTKNLLSTTDPYAKGNWYSIFGQWVQTWTSGDKTGANIYAKSVNNFAILGLSSYWVNAITRPSTSKGADGDGKLVGIYVENSTTNTNELSTTGWDSSFWVVDTENKKVTFKRNK